MKFSQHSIAMQRPPWGRYSLTGAERCIRMGQHAGDTADDPEELYVRVLEVLEKTIRQLQGR